MPGGAIGIEFISVLGLSPVEFVELAAELDCRSIVLTQVAVTFAGTSRRGH